MVFNTTFNNISVISWHSVLLVEKTADLPQVTDMQLKCLEGYIYLLTFIIDPILEVSEWLLLNPNSAIFFSYIMARTSYI